jgi:hypothetical protein
VLTPQDTNQRGHQTGARRTVEVIDTPGEGRASDEPEPRAVEASPSERRPVEVIDTPGEGSASDEPEPRAVEASPSERRPVEVIDAE